MYYKINNDSEYLQQIMTVYKWYERLVIYTLTMQPECPTDKHKTDPKTIQTFTQLAVHFTARSVTRQWLLLRLITQQLNSKSHYCKSEYNTKRQILNLSTIQDSK